MRKNSSFLFLWLLLLIPCLSVFAQAPQEYIGKHISFGPQKPRTNLVDKIKLDCFYNYTEKLPLYKQVRKNNRYYGVKGESVSDSIFNHIFSVVDYFNEGKKGHFIILKDDKADSLIFHIPFFKEKEKLDLDYNHYSHYCISESDNNGRLNFLNFNQFFPVFNDLTRWEHDIDTINATQSIQFTHPAIPIHKYRVESYSFDAQGLPVTSVYLYDNDTTEIFNRDQLLLLADDIAGRNAKIPVLKQFMDDFNSSLLDSLNRLIGSDIWVDETLFKRSISYSFRNGDEIYNRHPVRYDSENGWFKQAPGTLSSSALGGPTYSFYRGHVSSISLQPNHLIDIEKEEYRKSTYRPKEFIPSDSTLFKYYIVLSPLPDYPYNHWFGNPETDRVLLPIDDGVFDLILSDEQYKSIRNGFYEREQKEIDLFNEEQRAYMEIATRVWGKEIAHIVCRGEVRLGFDKDMCTFAFQRTPYRQSKYVDTPVGKSECYDFFMEGVKLYFQNDILVGIEWKGDKLFQPRHRY